MPAILIPLDGSRFAESAIPLGVTVANALDAEIHLVRVHELVALPAMDAVTPLPIVDSAMEEASRQQQRLELEASAADLRKLSHRPVHAALLEGSVVHALIEYARVNHASAIVTSTHGRSGIARAALGSVAEELARACGLPVLLLHPSDGQAPAAPPTFEHVLVPLDGSALSEAILPPALALLSGARRVTLFRMVAPVTMDLAPTPMPIAMSDPVSLEAEMVAAKAYLERVADTLTPQGYRVHVDVAANVAAPSAIEQAAASCAPDFIAIATHGRSGFSRLIMGSVAESLVARSRIPVMAFHPPGG
ncbi:MAG: universal stress protein [Gemmatimonadetes bacterium]|nr:universal stress protein [Gemmatimonadota bacterium]